MYILVNCSCYMDLNSCRHATETCHNFCDSCAKQGITSKLVQFHVNFKEALLLCSNKNCMYPFDSGEISTFFVQKKFEEKTFSAEPRFPRLQYSPDNGQNVRHEEAFRKGKAHVQNTPHLQRKRIPVLKCIDIKTSKAERSFFKMDKKQTLSSSVPKHKGSLVALRSKAADFEPYIPRKKNVCNDLMLANERDTENKDRQVYVDQPVDLKQSYKELTEDEEKFLADLVFN